MAEARPFPFTACVDHTNLTFGDFMTSIPPNCNFKPEKYARVFRYCVPSSALNCTFDPEKYSLAFREIVTLSATTYSSKSEESLEERQAEVERLREKHPDLIPVIILQAEGSQMQYPKKKLLIPAKDNLKEFFVSAWKILYELEIMSKTYSLFSGVEHKDPIFEKLMSSVYEEYKDEDGCLYITLSGEVKDMLTEEPIPSNIKTFTCYI